MSDPLAALDATAQAELVRTGQATPRELVDAAIARIEALNPRLNAVIHQRFEAAREEASGPLPHGPFRGVPLVVKDLDGTLAGEPYHAGSRHLLARGHVATETAWLFQRLIDAGFVVVGTTNTPELGLQPTTEPLAHGATHNPWAPERSPGGSSGGSAAAVASGMVPVGHAGDGGGSIRVPASACGLVGLKPSRGRVPNGPVDIEPWAGLVARLVVTRSVRDTAAVLDAVAGPGPGDTETCAPPPERPWAQEVGAPPGRLRVGVLTATGLPLEAHAECLAAVEATAEVLAELGHQVVRTHPAHLGTGAFVDELTAHFLQCYPVWVAAAVDDLGRRAGEPATAESVEPLTWQLAELGRSVAATAYQESYAFLRRAAQAIVRWWDEGHDVLLTPTMPVLPTRLGEFGAQRSEADAATALSRGAEVVAYTLPFNVTGQPAVSVPMHWSAEGLPVGVQLVGAPWREDVLVRLAAQLESARPWAHRRPLVFAG